MTRRLPDLESLELLVAVAETGSLGQAAARHGISQPSASARMGALERRLGVQLLLRSTSGSRLTPAGLIITERARAVLHEARELVAGADAFKVRGPERLRISASLTIAEQLMPAWLSTLRGASPGTQVELNVTNTSQVIEHIRGGAAEVGFIEGPAAPSDLHSSAVARDRLVVVVTARHPWARRREPLTVGELAATPLLVREPGSGTRETLESALGTIETALELGSTAALRNAALIGEAPAVLSVLAVADDLAAGRLREVALEIELNRTLRGVWARGRALTEPARLLLAIARRPR